MFIFSHIYLIDLLKVFHNRIFDGILRGVPLNVLKTKNETGRANLHFVYTLLHYERSSLFILVLKRKHFFMKAPRNKTIDLTLKEGRHYLERCRTVTQPVGIQNIENSTIYGDTFSVLPLLPEACVDLLIIDPLYNLTKRFHEKRVARTSDIDYAHYTTRWLCAVKPLLKAHASIYVCCDWQSSMLIGPLLKEHFYIRNRITWQREKGRGAAHNWKNSMEDIWFATLDEKNYTFNVDAVKMRRKVLAPYTVAGKARDWEQTDEGKFRDTFPSNFWDDISIPYWSMPENTAHPTQKPEKLLAKLILASSHEGDLILDPFLGSGTTSVTAKKLGRRYVGIEQNPQYCIWAEKRLEMANTDTLIQGFHDKVFWERNTTPAQKKINKKKRVIL